MPKRGKDGSASFWGMARSFLHDYCPRVRGLSPKTVDAYRMSLECLIEFTVANGTPREKISFEQLERPQLKAWIAWMRDDRGYTPKTVGLRMTAVKSFLRFCGNEDVSLADLYEGMRSLKAPAVPKGPLSTWGRTSWRRCSRLTKAQPPNRGATARCSSPCTKRARASELTGMSVGDLSLAKPAHATLLGKGSKTRVVPIGDKCAEHLRAYLDEFHPGNFRRDGHRPLFYSLHGGVPTALSDDAVSRVLKQAGDAARQSCPSVPERLHFHIIRKTRAMDLYKSGVPLLLVMQLLGHESMSTTSSFYAFATVDMMQRAIEQAAPKVLQEASDWLTSEKMEALYSLR